MAEFSHAFYIDEAGKAAPTPGINRLTVAAVVCIPFSFKATVDAAVRGMLVSHFHPGQRELKGSEIPKNLLQKSSSSDIGREVGAVLDSVGAHAWVVASEHGKTPPTNLGHLTDRSPKAIVRHLVLERLNGFLRFGPHQSSHFLLIWDITDQQELQDFSRSVAAFKNTVRDEWRSPRLAPAVLGGLSHDWSGLQLADVLANYALHRVGVDRNLGDALQQKATDFDLYFRHRLHRDNQGKPVGWKVF